MNSNFEEAYKAEVQQNIPDLWNRIESGLPEKEVQTNLNHKSNKKKKNPYAWMKWASLAAAAVLVIVLIPAMLGIGVLSMMSEKSSSADTAMNESAAEQMVVTDGTAEEEIKMESADMESVAETPAMNENFDEAVLSDVQSAESESEYPWEFYADGLCVKVISATATTEGYDVELELYSLHEAVAGTVLENSPYYDNGIINAVVYDGEGEVPVVGEKYLLTLYGTPEQFSMILPYKAVLELKE